MLGGIFTAIVTLLIVVVILYGAFWATKFIGQGYASASNSRNMNIVEQVTIGRDKSIAVVKAGDSFYLVGITPGSINLISQLNDDDKVEFEKSFYAGQLNNNNIAKPPFKDVFEKMKKRKK